MTTKELAYIEDIIGQGKQLEEVIKNLVVQLKSEELKRAIDEVSCINDKQIQSLTNLL
ncbi:MAG: hypothetical protein RSB77_00150 [Bacilli bacterium]